MILLDSPLMQPNLHIPIWGQRFILFSLLHYYKAKQKIETTINHQQCLLFWSADKINLIKVFFTKQNTNKAHRKEIIYLNMFIIFCYLHCFLDRNRSKFNSIPSGLNCLLLKVMKQQTGSVKLTAKKNRNYVSLLLQNSNGSIG